MKRNDEFINLTELRIMLHISSNAAQELAEKGQIPGRKIGRTWHFYKPDVIQFIRTGNVDKTA